MENTFSVLEVRPRICDVTKKVNNNSLTFLSLSRDTLVVALQFDLRPGANYPPTAGRLIGS
jgi:hypothetical protein